jgi:hypothetical protein
MKGWVVSTAPRPLYPRERPGTHCTGGWVGLGTAWTRAKNLVPTGIAVKVWNCLTFRNRLSYIQDGQTVCPIYRTGTSLPSKHPILYIFSTNIGNELFKHAAHSPFFSLQNAVYFIMLPFLVPVLFAFYVQGVQKFKCQILVLKS